jgi:hypothetical protein
LLNEVSTRFGVFSLILLTVYFDRAKMFMTFGCSH